MAHKHYCQVETQRVQSSVWQISVLSSLPLPRRTSMRLGSTFGSSPQRFFCVLMQHSLPTSLIKLCSLNHHRPLRDDEGNSLASVESFAESSVEVCATSKQRCHSVHPEAGAKCAMKWLPGSVVHNFSVSTSALSAVLMHTSNVKSCCGKFEFSALGEEICEGTLQSSREPTRPIWSRGYC